MIDEVNLHILDRIGFLTLEILGNYDKQLTVL